MLLGTTFWGRDVMPWFSVPEQERPVGWDWVTRDSLTMSFQKPYYFNGLKSRFEFLIDRWGHLPVPESSHIFFTIGSIRTHNLTILCHRAQPLGERYHALIFCSRARTANSWSWLSTSSCHRSTHCATRPWRTPSSPSGSTKRQGKNLTSLPKNFDVFC